MNDSSTPKNQATFFRCFRYGTRPAMIHRSTVLASTCTASASLATVTRRSSRSARSLSFANATVPKDAIGRLHPSGDVPPRPWDVLARSHCVLTPRATLAHTGALAPSRTIRKAPNEGRFGCSISLSPSFSPTRGAVSARVALSPIDPLGYAASARTASRGAASPSPPIASPPTVRQPGGASPVLSTTSPATDWRSDVAAHSSSAGLGSGHPHCAHVRRGGPRHPLRIRLSGDVHHGAATPRRGGSPAARRLRRQTGRHRRRGQPRRGAYRKLHRLVDERRPELITSPDWLLGGPCPRCGSPDILAATK